YGEGWRLGNSLRCEDGQGNLCNRTGCFCGTLLCLAGGRERSHLHDRARRRHDYGLQGRRGDTESCGEESETRRTRVCDPGPGRQHDLCAVSETLMGLC